MRGGLSSGHISNCLQAAVDVEGFELITKIATSKTVAEAWSLLTRRLEHSGFARVNYGYTRQRNENPLLDPENTVYLSTHDPDYVERYFHGGFYARTPIFRWLSKNEGYCTWRWVEEDFRAGRLTEDEANAVAQNRDSGIIAGVTISFPENSTRAKGAIGLAANVGYDHDDVDALWAREGRELLALCHVAHLRIASLPLPISKRPLTNRQREVLEWVAEGKTTQDIAMLMGISTAMVEKHLRLTRDALDVETTAHAVAKAALFNQIFVRD